MRADRLVATLLVLQARGRVTAAELAEELEVSERTARRDLEGLSMAGVPVYSRRGRGGGWQLIGGARTDLSGLTGTEARALFLLAGPSAAVSPDAKSALRKLVQALPETFREEARAAASAVVIDPATWGRDAPTPPPHFEKLQRAVVEGVQVVIGYTDRSRAETERTVHPLGLVAKGNTWYLVTDTDAGLRTFRLGRIRSVAFTDQPVVRPLGFDLAVTWREVVAQMEERRPQAWATVWLATRDAGALRGQFGRDFEMGRELGDGRVQVRVCAPSMARLAEQLAGWGNHLEVVEPDELRGELARLGAELVATYRAAATC